MQYDKIITVGRARVRPVPVYRLQSPSMASVIPMYFFGNDIDGNYRRIWKTGHERRHCLRNQSSWENLPAREKHLFDTLPTLLLLYEYTICDFWRFAENSPRAAMQPAPGGGMHAPCKHVLPVNPPLLCSENVQYILCDMQTSSLAGRVEACVVENFWVSLNPFLLVPHFILPSVRLGSSQSCPF